MRLIGENLEIINDAQIWIASFAFTETPSKSREVVRSFLLKDKFDITFGQSISALLVVRMIDSTALFFYLH